MIDTKQLRRVAEAALWTGNWYDQNCNALGCDYNAPDGDGMGHDEIAHQCRLA